MHATGNDPSIDYKALVQRGYDRCAAAYEDARHGQANPELDLLLRRLADGAHVLDIGCGAGVPIAHTLAQRFQVTGIDISEEQIRRARRNVPEATFLHGDVMSMTFPPASFDAAVAFYSIFHLPREEHPELLRRIHGWLKPGGYLLATVTSVAEAAYTEDDFFGATMYWSNYGLEDYKAILTEIGFNLLDTTFTGHGYTAEKQIPAEHHPLIFAQVI
ncbi:MAG: class I SAM-dependent methyltransferase [Chloroflexi bacterium]|nr:class I SAM-dependent methyltransferase [Chloroflexota bacterium]